MSSDNPTTVRLTETGEKIKAELAPIFGLKNILSAGLLLFSRLSDTEQKKIVADVNKMARAAREADEVVSGAQADAAKQKQKARRSAAKRA